MLGAIYGAPGRPVGRTGPVVVYGNRWCGITMMVRRYLDRLGVPYQFVDMETHPEVRHQLEWVTGGYVASPTVYVDGEVLVQPSIRELESALARSGTR